MRWVKQHKFESYLIAFILMIVPPLPAYYAAINGASAWVWAMLLVIILGNLFVLVID